MLKYKHSSILETKTASVFSNHPVANNELVGMITGKQLSQVTLLSFINHLL